MSVFNVGLRHVVDDSYDIEIGYGLSDRLAEDIAGGLFGSVKKFAIITDSNVRDLYAKPICEKLAAAGFLPDIFAFPAGEKSKTRHTKEQIEDAMLEKGYRRDCAVIAVGGGVVTDLAGFVAGTFGRGVPFVNYATTLLAAADASVGGKTAVDTPLATNLIGMFNQPKKVYIDISAWETLPKRELACGLAETIKHACLGSFEMFEFLEEHLDDILNLQKSACEHISECNCKIKYNIVMQDERESSGLREVLNLGHTVGRAIETVSDYRLLHGEAVAIGMAAEALLSARLGYMAKDEAGRVIALYDRAGLPTKIPDFIDREALVKKLYTDKKVRDGKLRFVLQKGIGNVVEFSPGVFSTPIEEDLAREIIMEL
ncbi:MAG: 3-dehydroquinate synthase [Clostridiales bacterium]|nr:3-dehydroquinate synthase [Clostridiales bacterium]